MEAFLRRLRVLLESPDPAAEIRAHPEGYDADFFLTLAALAREARAQGEEEVARRLEDLGEILIEATGGEVVPPQTRSVAAALNAAYGQPAQALPQLLTQHPALATPEAVAGARRLAETTGDPAWARLAEALAALREEAEAALSFPDPADLQAELEGAFREGTQAAAGLLGWWAVHLARPLARLGRWVELTVLGRTLVEGTPSFLEDPEVGELARIGRDLGELLAALGALGVGALKAQGRIALQRQLPLRARALDERTGRIWELEAWVRRTLAELPPETREPFLRLPSQDPPEG